MGKKERNLKKETLLEALENSLGIVSTACNRTGISRSSFYKWYHEDEEFRKKVDEIDNVKLDYVETKLFKNIENEKEKVSYSIFNTKDIKGDTYKSRI